MRKGMQIAEVENEGLLVFLYDPPTPLPSKKAKPRS